MRRAFTLIELLIVIFVIGLLTVIIVVVASQAQSQQRKALTKATMDNVLAAIEQFKTANPLKSVYDSKRVYSGAGGRVEVGPSFGPYPPYQIDGNTNPGSNSIRSVVEPDRSSVGGPIPPPTLADRLWRDIGNSGPPRDKWVAFAMRAAPDDDRGLFDDNRALYAYLRTYSAAALAQVPPTAIKPLKKREMGPTYKDILNPTGAGTNPGDSGAIDVLGIHDAWGVPLDYFLYVRVQRYDNNGTAAWRVTDRIPVLRSHGISREEFDNDAQHAGGDIYSSTLTQPYASIDSNGVLMGAGSNAAQDGWLRLRAAAQSGVQEEYGYLPE